jgi:2-oxoglutarate ferredoxin oxidoreductase subunit beta
LRVGRYGALEAADVEGADPASLLTHDAGQVDPSYAFAMSRLDNSDIPATPIGVFRKVERPSYDALMADQLTEAKNKQGDGDLAALLSGGDAWTIG